MTEQEMSNLGWNPCYTTVCISFGGKIVRIGDERVMVRYAKENNIIVAKIEILNFDKEKES